LRVAQAGTQSVSDQKVKWGKYLLYSVSFILPACIFAVLILVEFESFIANLFALIIYLLLLPILVIVISLFLFYGIQVSMILRTISQSISQQEEERKEVLRRTTVLMIVCLIGFFLSFDGCLALNFMFLFFLKNEHQYLFVE